VEADPLSARVTKNGVTEKVQTDEAVFALFRHNTSRNLDPQTHTHAILMNLGDTEDGKWRARGLDLAAYQTSSCLYSGLSPQS
jgi:conjugative relaxase-like TrwC/TraI family protein